jgi:probable nitrogen fixation protein
MTSLALLNPPQLTLDFSELFLQELIEQFHLQDQSKVYHNWSDRLVLDFFINSEQQKIKASNNFNFDYLNQLLISSFYHAIAKIIEEKTGHSTQAFIQLKNKEFSSAVVFCGGVLVVYSLICGKRKYGFDSSKQLLEEAQKIIETAIAKASLYLDIA